MGFWIIENVGLSGRPRSGSERKPVYFLGWWAGLDDASLFGSYEQNHRKILPKMGEEPIILIRPDKLIL